MTLRLIWYVKLSDKTFQVGKKYVKKTDSILTRKIPHLSPWSAHCPVADQVKEINLDQIWWSFGVIRKEHQFLNDFT